MIGQVAEGPCSRRFDITASSGIPNEKDLYDGREVIFVAVVLGTLVAWWVLGVCSSWVYCAAELQQYNSTTSVGLTEKLHDGRERASFCCCSRLARGLVGISSGGAKDSTLLVGTSFGGTLLFVHPSERWDFQKEKKKKKTSVSFLLPVVD